MDDELNAMYKDVLTRTEQELELRFTVPFDARVEKEAPNNQSALIQAKSDELIVWGGIANIGNKYIVTLLSPIGDVTTFELYKSE